MGGVDVDKFSLGPILRKRIRLEGSTLRSRPDAFKAQLVRSFTEECIPALARGDLKPVIETSFDLSEMRQAHELMESNATIGKIVITVKHEDDDKQ
jgi:NADPH2:quinone reductase